MGIWHLKSRRKSTGGLLKKHRSPKKSQMGSLPTKTTIAPVKLKKKKTRGGNMKIKIFSSDQINVLNKKTKEFKKAKIISVLKNPANHNFVRRSIMTKGAIIKTDKGDVKVTSRPGQDSVLNGVLIE